MSDTSGLERVQALGRFVGGTGRCGTALLGSVFAAHPEVTYFREPRFISDPGGLCDYMRGKFPLEHFKERMLRDFRRNLITKLATVEMGPVRQIYSRDAIGALLNETMAGEDRFADGRRFVEALFGLMGRPCWVEKTPHTVMYADLLYRMFPDMRYVHMIREPKDIYASLLEQDWGPKNLGRFVNWYKRIMKQAGIAAVQVPDENYKVIELEALVCNPLTGLYDVLEFMAIPFDVDWLHGMVSGIDAKKAHIGRYKDEISVSAQELIDRECGGLYRYWQAKAYL